MRRLLLIIAHVYAVHALIKSCTPHMKNFQAQIDIKNIRRSKSFSNSWNTQHGVISSRIKGVQMAALPLNGKNQQLKQQLIGLCDSSKSGLQPFDTLTKSEFEKLVGSSGF